MDLGHLYTIVLNNNHVTNFQASVLILYTQVGLVMKISFTQPSAESQVFHATNEH